MKIVGEVEIQDEGGRVKIVFEVEIQDKGGRRGGKLYETGLGKRTS